MGTEDNRAVVLRYYAELWNQWKLDLADELLARDIRFRGSLGVQVRGIEGFKNYMAVVRAAFPDFRNTIEEMFAEADRVVARLTYRGTHQGELFGIPATGKQVTYRGVAIFRFADARIAEGWVLGDTLGLLEQLLRPKFWKAGVSE